MQLTNGQRLFLKYAGDTVGAGVLVQRLLPKPRRRLATERRALKWLKANLRHDAELPEIVHFDPSTWTLVVKEVCAGGTSLESHLENGRFDPLIAKNASQFLAACHTITGPIQPLWGKAQTDRQHWERVLDLQTVEIHNYQALPEPIRLHLAMLKDASLRATTHRFLHLNYSPPNILIEGKRIGVIDFELASSVGDPACDLGIFLGHYVYWILKSSTVNSWHEAIQNALQAYQQGGGELWERMDLQVIAFTGATLLNLRGRDDCNGHQDFASRVMQAGTVLLAQGLQQHGAAERILCETIHDFSTTLQ